MSDLNFTPLWYVKARRDKLIKSYNNIIIILYVILIVCSLIFMSTFLNMSSLRDENKEISEKITSLTTTGIERYNVKFIEMLSIKLPKDVNYSEMILENNTIFIDFKYVDKKSYTDNLKLLEKINELKITFIGVPEERETGKYYRVGMKRR